MEQNVKLLTLQIGDDGPVVTVKGRVAWATAQLIAAGETGCTPISHPAPRWSDAIFKMRKVGLAVETVTESHGGPYAGHHGRYILRSSVVVIAREAA